MVDLSYPTMLRLFTEHLDPNRSESASFLIWYLENYYRLDPQDAVDAVCDQPGDKGVDGIFVNDNDMTITVFQTKISQSGNATIGDSVLRTFAGTLKQFDSPQSIQTLISGAGTAQVAALAKRLDLVNKIATHELRAEFIANVDADKNAHNFLASAPIIKFIGRELLKTTYISDERTIPQRSPVAFDIVGFEVTQYIVDANTKALIAPIKATELVTLNGISDQSLYAYNVRGPLGRTQVNKDIVSSITDRSRHKLFPLIHNGITIICRSLAIDKNGLGVSDYFVVNGCQSLTALYDNRKSLTDDLRVLTKFIQMEPGSTLAEMVTRFSNNQNGVKARDFMANNPIQIRLQNEFRQHYAGKYTFEIKRGESAEPGVPISNESVGLFLMAFDLKEPWGTHRKYQVFEDKHADLFARPEVSADRVVLCQVIVEAIDKASQAIKNTLFARYILTRYFLLYCVRQILENDALAEKILKHPEKFVRKEADRDRFRESVNTIVSDMVVDLNHEIADYGKDFDYRDKLRDAEWARELSKKIVGSHTKLVARNRIRSFAEEWEGSSVPQK